MPPFIFRPSSIVTTLRGACGASQCANMQKRGSSTSRRRKLLPDNNANRQILFEPYRSQLGPKYGCIWVGSNLLSCLWMYFFIPRPWCVLSRELKRCLNIMFLPGSGELMNVLVLVILFTKN